MPKKEEDITEDERIIEWHERRYESLRERFNLYRKALYLACDNDKEKVKLTLEKVGF